MCHYSPSLCLADIWPIRCQPVNSHAVRYRSKNRFQIIIIGRGLVWGISSLTSYSFAKPYDWNFFLALLTSSKSSFAVWTWSLSTAAISGVIPSMSWYLRKERGESCKNSPSLSFSDGTRSTNWEFFINFQGCWRWKVQNPTRMLGIWAHDDHSVTTVCLTSFPSLFPSHLRVRNRALERGLQPSQPVQLYRARISYLEASCCTQLTPYVKCTFKTY